VLPESGPLCDDLREAGVEVHVRSLAVLRRSLMSPRGISRVAAAWASDAGGLGRLARTRGVAVVHTNTSVTLGGATAARIAGVPHVWHVREIYAAFDRWFPAYRRLLLTAHALPCVSQATCEQFGGDPRATVLHDAPAIDVHRVDRAEARAQLGLPAEAFVVVVLGRIATWKGQELVVRALAQLPEDSVALLGGAPWPGDERLARELDQLAVALGVRDRVLTPGIVDAAAAYAAADVVAVPSTLPDPFPNSALEAAAHGCCVVGAAHGGIPEILGDAGVLVAPGDTHALAEALAELRADPARREALGAAAAARVAERYGRERMLGEVQALYDRLLA
jgi:glycosyltransferase involved in cell wall biosynthesis